MPSISAPVWGRFLFADMRLLTAGPRAVAAPCVHAGFEKTRIVLRQWNPNFRSAKPARRPVPQLLLVSSMQIHSASAYEMIADAYRSATPGRSSWPAAPRRFTSRGTSSAVGGEAQYSADVVVTGEEYVILELLDRIMEYRAGNEHLRKTFHRCAAPACSTTYPAWSSAKGMKRAPLGGSSTPACSGWCRTSTNCRTRSHSLGLLEPPHRRPSCRASLAVDKLQRYAGMISLVTTHGCKFHCPYCPIPAYNQFTFRFKRPGPLRDEMPSWPSAPAFTPFFGTDDNFFNNRETVEEVFTELARARSTASRSATPSSSAPRRPSSTFQEPGPAAPVPRRRPAGHLVRHRGHDRRAGQEGPEPGEDQELFECSTSIGICPMPMMMHHDGQPLTSRGNLYGLLNQVNFLRKSGSVSVQVTILTPSVGSKGYEEPYERAWSSTRPNGHKVEDYQYDGNHCIATEDPTLAQAAAEHLPGLCLASTIRSTSCGPSPELERPALDLSFASC
jgi:hypothetical protein